MTTVKMEKHCDNELTVQLIIFHHVENYRRKNNTRNLECDIQEIQEYGDPFDFNGHISSNIKFSIS